MTYTRPESVSNPTAGSSILASWGDAVNDAINWLAGDGSSSNPKPMVCVYRAGATTQAVATSTVTAVNCFDAELFDTANMWTSGTPSRITFPVGGRYSFGGNITIQGNSTGVREISMRRNGGATVPNYVAAQGLTVVGSGDQRMNISGMWSFVAGDYIELTVWQTSGGNLNVVAENGRSPVMWAKWEAPA